MTLLRLALRNFKGVRDFVFEPGGADASVYADNGVGKTTLADAWAWLLFGKDSAGRADFEIKTLDADGKALSGLEHSVEAEIETATGRLTLQKVYKETWTTKRGGATQVFDGHSTDHLVNGVPARKGDYDARVADLLPATGGRGRSALESERTWRVLTDPAFLVSDLKWQDRRAMLFALAGEATDEDVIAASPELAALPEILGQHTIDDYRKIAKAAFSKSKEEKERIPIQIAEADRALPKLAPGNWAETLASARARLADHQEFRATIVAGGAAGDKTARLRVVEGDMQAIVNRLREAPDHVRAAAIAKGREIDQARQASADAHTSLQRRIQEADSDLAKMDRALASMRERYKAENAKACDAPDACPACGQSIPEESRAAALAAYNEAKARRLAEVQAEGKSLRERRDALAAELEEWRDQASESAAAIVRLNAEKAAHVVPEPTAIVPTEDPAYAALVEEQQRLRAEIEELKADSTAAIENVDGEIREAQKLVDEATGHILSAKHRESGQERIDQLGRREKELAAEIERLHHHLHLCETFVRAKVAALTDRVNARFALVRWKLFDEQINGGLVECCEATADGVPYGSLNTAAQINVGLDCIDAFADYLGFAPPVFVDRAESVTRVRSTAGQQIRLVVSGPDKSLRVEVAAGGRSTARQPQEALL